MRCCPVHTTGGKSAAMCQAAVQCCTTAWPAGEMLTCWRDQQHVRCQVSDVRAVVHASFVVLLVGAFHGSSGVLGSSGWVLHSVSWMLLGGDELILRLVLVKIGCWRPTFFAADPLQWATRVGLNLGVCAEHVLLGKNSPECRCTV